jgi:hypothetical protein
MLNRWSRRTSVLVLSMGLVNIEESGSSSCEYLNLPSPVKAYRLLGGKSRSTWPGSSVVVVPCCARSWSSPPSSGINLMIHDERREIPATSPPENRTESTWALSSPSLFKSMAWQGSHWTGWWSKWCSRKCCRVRSKMSRMVVEFENESSSNSTSLYPVMTASQCPFSYLLLRTTMRSRKTWGNDRGNVYSNATIRDTYNFILERISSARILASWGVTKSRYTTALDGSKLAGACCASTKAASGRNTSWCCETIDEHDLLLVVVLVVVVAMVAVDDPCNDSVHPISRKRILLGIFHVVKLNTILLLDAVILTSTRTSI